MYPPHGGEDPGKIGTNGVLEKDINLKIAKKIKTDLEASGLHVKMTRTKDKGVHNDDAGNKKVADLKNRVEMINGTLPKIAVSIHQNSYTSADVKGAQVFYYADSGEGKIMAEKIKEALVTLGEENNRPVKANKTYYLLKRTKVPTLIVECGFLSNPEEAEKLTDDGYQEKMSKAVAKGIRDCLK